MHGRLEHGFGYEACVSKHVLHPALAVRIIIYFGASGYTMMCLSRCSPRPRKSIAMLDCSVHSASHCVVNVCEGRHSPLPRAPSPCPTRVHQVPCPVPLALAQHGFTQYIVWFRLHVPNPVPYQDPFQSAREVERPVSKKLFSSTPVKDAEEISHIAFGFMASKVLFGGSLFSHLMFILLMQWSYNR